MAKRRNVVSSGDVDFNMTPMIDCTFQLIIFFILVSQTANEAYAKNVKIVRPIESQAIPGSVAQFPNKVTVNVVSAAAGDEDADLEQAAAADFYKINTEKFEVGEWDRMIEVIRMRKREFEQQFGTAPAPNGSDEEAFFLEVRADERVSWRDVAPVIRAGVKAGIKKMNKVGQSSLPLRN